MHAFAWILPAFCLTCGEVRPSLVLEEEVDLMELNHFYDDCGRHVYDQIIFYEWGADLREYHVRAWCLISCDEKGQNQIWHTHFDDRCHVRWFDRDQRQFRQIHSNYFRETWSNIDPERANKKKLDERLRTALIQPQSRAKIDSAPTMLR